MPPTFRKWTASAKSWAAAMGMKYKLWGEVELWQTFGKEEEVRTLRTCLDTLPTPTSYSFASDFFRMRLVAEYGGLYLDADTNCQALVELPKKPGLYCSVERFNPRLWSTWLLWAPGEGGRAAARALWAAARAHFNEILPPFASDIPSRYIWQVRRDMPGHGAGAMGLGPAVFRRTMLPQLKAAGWHVEALPADVASCRNEQAALKQCNAWSWKEPTADWQARAEEAKKKEERDALPTWQRAQSSRVMPAALHRKRKEMLVPAARWEDGLNIPRGARRIVIFSNVVKDFDPRALPLQPGDHCIHINRARQFFKVVDMPGVTHALVVRRGTEPVNRRIRWYDPPAKDGFTQVLHIADVPMRARRPWWRDYCQRYARQCPTTGFICWHLAQEAAPSLPVVLAGFAPGENFGTHQWRGHAWAHEADEYARAGVRIVRPDAPGMSGSLPRVKCLVMVCSGQQNHLRREEIRATWAREVPRDMAVRFWSGAENQPGCEDANAGDMVSLPGIGHNREALPAATLAMLRWAVAHWNFDHLFCCHDDTFTALPRLANVVMPRGAAMVGNPDAVRVYVAMHGGAGYILSRDMVELLAYQPPALTRSPADVYISQEVQRQGGVLMPDRRFHHKTDLVPAPGNALITAHGCQPGDMVRIMDALTK